MRLPEWLIKAGAKFENGRLYFDKFEVDYQQATGVDEDEIPTVYQVRYHNGEDSFPTTGFSCGLDLVQDKKLVWISGAYFDTFAKAFRYWETNIRREYEGKTFEIHEDHSNLTRWSDDNIPWGDETQDELKEMAARDRQITWQPRKIKLLPEGGV